jgi:hypothetical protein
MGEPGHIHARRADLEHAGQHANDTRDRLSAGDLGQVGLSEILCNGVI